jgi:phosphatidylethanolamine-binding protein (PEBP) family uncharacterized protein
MSEFALGSRAFQNAEAIPSRHGCEGDDVSPQLHWTNIPYGTRSLALVVDDPDAPGGVFTHWIAGGCVFRLYALDAELELGPGAAKAELEWAIQGHVLTTAELVGTYER